MIKEKLEEALGGIAGGKVILEIAKGEFGDFCLNPGQIKESGQNSEELAAKIKSALDGSGLVKEVKSEAGYINIYLSKQAYFDELERIVKDESYLKNNDYQNQTIVFDYSSPNIAKPFSVGHLRSTIIGQANYNIHEAIGYKTVGINHIGDWGTQFGKLIVAIKKWGVVEEIAKNPIKELNRLYQRFHEEAEKDESLNEEARQWFKKLEDADAEALELWQKCVDWSLEEFERIYQILGVKIDEVKGESFYEDKLEGVIDELKQKNLLKESEGAQIVELEKMPPALIKKSDGATLYMTRDLAALKHRIETYKPSRIIYHVGGDQALHFKQLEAVAKKLGWLEKTEIVFAGHGLMRLKSGKMSTRRGQVVLLEDLIGEAKERALKIIEEKNPDLENKESAAQQIGISAIKYADLSTNRRSDVVFSFDKIISLEGNSGPYLQYSYARCASLKRKFEQKHKGANIQAHLDDSALKLAKLLKQIGAVLESAAKISAPNQLADLAYRIANEFNALYEKERFIVGDAEQSSKNFFIVEATQKVLGKIFDLLGIEKLDEI
ncbi:MAG: arginine--tRNA ligase [Candidatus Berkelbacteria bacterium]|nr:arginine--tRNA ligase [Candidatus Berkelbacteria bacterium]